MHYKGFIKADALEASDPPHAGASRRVPLGSRKGSAAQCRLHLDRPLG
jgi:hypothetical protein